MMKKLNQWIADQYSHLGKIEFVRGNGYFYFIDHTYSLEIESIYVCYLHQATFEQWKNHITTAITEAVNRSNESYFTGMN